MERFAGIVASLSVFMLCLSCLSSEDRDHDLLDAKIRALIPKLDHEDFDTRTQAYADLRRVGVRAIPMLKRALRGAVSPESAARLGRLLAEAWVSQLLSDDVERYLSARRQLLRLGALAHETVTKALRRAPQDPVKVLRLQSVEVILRGLTKSEDRLRTIEAAMSACERQRKRIGARNEEVALLFRRTIFTGDAGMDLAPYGKFHRFSFGKGVNHLALDATVEMDVDGSLRFWDYGNHSANRLLDLGESPFDQAGAPVNPDRRKGWKTLRSGLGIHLRPGHTYLYHNRVASKQLDRTFVFRLLEKTEAWMVIRWAAMESRDGVPSQR
jgi:hypothetical protein